MTYVHLEHDFTRPLLGGMLGCSRAKCPAVKPALAREHSAPSKEAAIKAESVRTRQQALVWNALASFPDGLTTEQVCSITGLSSDSVRPRLVELDEQGRATRATLDGKPYHPITNKEVWTRKNKRGFEMTIWLAVR